MRALIISFHFPPILGMASRRMACCAKALASMGNEVDVLTVKPEEDHPVYPIDSEEMKLVDDRVKVHRVPMGIVNRFVAKMALGGGRYLNSNGRNGHSSSYISSLGDKLYKARWLWQPFAVPDASVDWLPGAIVKTRSLLTQHSYQLVVTHGNPNTCHLVAYYSLGKRKVRLVSDYGDAWGTNSFLETLPKWRKRIDQFLERRFLKRVDLITTSSEGIALSLRSQYGLDPSKTFVVPSSFVDIEEYKAIQPTPSSRFEVVFTGNIHYGVQDPLAFLAALERFRANELQLSVAGQVTPEFVRFVESNGLERFVELKGYVNRAQVMRFQRNASVLLLFGGGMQIPAKLYEYFAAQRPILCIAYAEGDPGAALVQKHNRGVVVPNDPRRILSALRQFIDLHATHQLESSFSLEDLPEYSFKGASEKFLRGVLS